MKSQKRYLIFLSAVIFTLPFTSATTWSSKDITCLLCDTENEFSVINSYGGYIYNWPSKYQYIFWPLTTKYVLYSCKKCYLTCYMWDFEKIPKDKKKEIMEKLKLVSIDWSNVESYEKLSMITRLKVAEKVYSTLEKNDEFWCRFYRVMGYHYAKAKKHQEANTARQKALEIVERMVTQKENVKILKELLYIKGAMHYFLKEVDQAKKDFQQGVKLQHQNKNLDRYLNGLFQYYINQITVEEVSETLQVSTTTELLERIRDEKTNQGVKAKIIQIMEERGEQSSDMILALIHNLRYKDERRFKYWEIIEAFKKMRKKVIPILIAELHQKQSDVSLRIGILYVLQKMDVPEALPLFIDSIQDEKSEEMRKIAARGTKVSVTEAIPLLIDILQTPKTPAQVRISVIEALAGWEIISELKKRNKECERLIPTLIDSIKNEENKKLKEIAAETLAELAPMGISNFIDILQQKDISLEIKILVIKTLGKWQPSNELKQMDKQCKRLNPILIDLLRRENNKDLRKYITDVMVRIQTNTEALIELYRDKDLNTETRISVLKILGQGYTKSKEAIPFIIKAIKQGKNKKMRQVAARACVEVGPEIIPLLVQVLKDTDLKLKQTAEDIIKMIGLNCIPILEKSIEGQDPSIKIFLIENIGKVGKKILPELKYGLKLSKRYRSLRLPISFKREIATIKNLVKMLDDQDERVRYAILAALGDIGIMPVEAEQVLLKLSSSDPSERVRKSASEVLKKNQKQTKKLTSILLETFYVIRWERKFIIKMLDEITVHTLPLLIEKFKDENSSLGAKLEILDVLRNYQMTDEITTSLISVLRDNHQGKNIKELIVSILKNVKSPDVDKVLREWESKNQSKENGSQHNKKE